MRVFLTLLRGKDFLPSLLILLRLYLSLRDQISRDVNLPDIPCFLGAVGDHRIIKVGKDL